VQAVAFTPDGRRVLSVSDDKYLRVWDAASGRELLPPIEGHEDKVASLSISADGRRVVTASRDATALVWDLQKLLAK
jgi:WD40 repeat protein